tara:strand:- start:32 stop:223 length:192 start_codon:yes stop_codon:yes gene_type:complete
MAEYRCKCNDEIVTTGEITIRYVEGKGIIHDIQCESCGEYLDLANPKSGVPKLGRMNSSGSSY